MVSLRYMIKTMVSYYHSRYADTIYNIGIIPHSDDILTRKQMPQAKWLDHPYNDRWFADPFIVAEDDSTYTIFVETYYYGVRKGDLGMIVADKKNFKLQSYKDILVLPTHLSFPCYYYQDGELYVYPENSRSGCNTLYHFDKQQEKLAKVKVQADFPWTDAAAMTADRKWLTTTYKEDCNGSTCHVFHIDEESGKYLYKHDIEFYDNTARGAGLPFQTADGRWIRPAQNCNGGYGLGLVFQEITFGGDKLQLKEINRLAPNDKKYNIGLHTYNRFGDVAIVDGYYGPSAFGAWCWKQIQRLIQ